MKSMHLMFANPSIRYEITRFYLHTLVIPSISTPFFHLYIYYNHTPQPPKNTKYLKRSLRSVSQFFLSAFHSFLLVWFCFAFDFGCLLVCLQEVHNGSVKTSSHLKFESTCVSVHKGRSLCLQMCVLVSKGC